MELIIKLFGFMVRVGLLLVGLVFFAAVMATALLVLLIWLLRALWSRLTGQPVSPWTFQINRKAVWQRFYRGSSGQRGSSARSANDEVVDVSAADVNVVTDVEPKRIDSAPR